MQATTKKNVLITSSTIDCTIINDWTIDPLSQCAQMNLHSIQLHKCEVNPQLHRDTTLLWPLHSCLTKGAHTACM